MTTFTATKTLRWFRSFLEAICVNEHSLEKEDYILEVKYFLGKYNVPNKGNTPVDVKVEYCEETNRFNAHISYQNNELWEDRYMELTEQAENILAVLLFEYDNRNQLTLAV